MREWHGELSADVTRGPNDPLFPATAMTLNESGAFTPAGLARDGWSGTGPVRAGFQRGFQLAGIKSYNPHSFRDMLVHHAMALNLGPEAMKAWSQNLGHADVLTTFYSYGQVSTQKQGELIRAGMKPKAATIEGDAIAELEAVLAKIKASAKIEGNNIGKALANK